MGPADGAHAQHAGTSGHRCPCRSPCSCGRRRRPRSRRALSVLALGRVAWAGVGGFRAGPGPQGRGAAEAGRRLGSADPAGPVCLRRASSRTPGSARGEVPAVRLPLDEQPADAGAAPALHRASLGHLPGEARGASPLHCWPCESPRGAGPRVLPSCRGRPVAPLRRGSHVSSAPHVLTFCSGSVCCT